MTVSNEERILIMNLIKSCNELIDGKFILADSKINKILKDIAESKEVFNLLSECMLNFNFDKEFLRAKVKTPTKPGFFKMPDEKYKLLPMVFCLLVDIDSRKLDFPTFLKEYFFIPESEDSEFKNFVGDVIKPFRNAISEIFDLPLIINERLLKSQNSSEAFKILSDTNEKTDFNKTEIEEVGNMEEEKEENIYSKVITISKEMISCVAGDYRLKENAKDDAKILLGGIIRASEIEDLKILNALLIGFDFIGKNIKSIRFLYKELKETMMDYYVNG